MWTDARFAGGCRRQAAGHSSCILALSLAFGARCFQQELGDVQVLLLEIRKSLGLIPNMSRSGLLHLIPVDLGQVVIVHVFRSADCLSVSVGPAEPHRTMLADVTPRELSDMKVSLSGCSTTLFPTIGLRLRSRD